MLINGWYDELRHLLAEAGGLDRRGHRVSASHQGSYHQGGQMV
jgi:hypothetical protein